MDEINAQRAARIFVVTDHPSYRYESRRGLVTQLHVGQDVDGYERALSIADQADVDVVALEDVPTLETLRQALSLAEAGRLVIANLHATTPVEAVERLLESAREEIAALRRSLAANLVAVTAQRLLPSADGTRRLPAYEWLANSEPVRAALLAGGDLAEAQRDDPESRALGPAVRDLYMAGRITLETAFAHAPPDDRSSLPLGDLTT